MGPRSKWAIAGGAFLVLVAIAAFAFQTRALPVQGEPRAGATPAQSSPLPPAAVPGHSPDSDERARSVAEERVVRLESALVSGDGESLAQFLGLGDDEPSEDFVAEVAAMGLQLPRDTLTPIGERLWNVRGIDRGGNAWDIGLLVDGGQTTMIYAEFSEEQ